MHTRILGIDYGDKKIGLAVSVGRLASPFMVIKNDKKLMDELADILEKEKIDKIVVGISEGETAKRTTAFLNEIKEKFDIRTEISDESLSTYDAIDLSIKAGLKRNKRRKLEDAYAASVMLQNYLDNKIID